MYSSPQVALPQEFKNWPAWRASVFWHQLGCFLTSKALSVASQGLAAVVMRAPFVDVLSAMSNSSLPMTLLEHEEWGDPKSAEGLAGLAKMCPYHNMQPSTFPPLLVSGATNDVRVSIAGVAKWVARMRAKQQGPAPVLLNAQSSGGHFGDEAAELNLAATELAFMLEAVG